MEASQIGTAYEESTAEVSSLEMRLKIERLDFEVSKFVASVPDKKKHRWIMVNFGVVIRSVKQLFLQAVEERHANKIRRTIMRAIKKCFDALEKYIIDNDAVTNGNIQAACALAGIYHERFVGSFETIHEFIMEIATMYSEYSAVEPHLNSSKAFEEHLRKMFWSTDRIQIKQNMDALVAENAKLKKQLESIQSMIKENV